MKNCLYTGFDPVQKELVRFSSFWKQVIVNRTILITLFIVIVRFSHLSAQEALPAGGGTATGSGGSASFTVGQLVYTTNSGTTGSVSQGVQQAYTITVTGIKDLLKGITLQCTVYPNPVLEYLTLNIEGNEFANLNYWLYDINGKVLKSRPVFPGETVIPMQELSPSTYFLKVQGAGTNRIKVFKIIKN